MGHSDLEPTTVPTTQASVSAAADQSASASTGPAQEFATQSAPNGAPVSVGVAASTPPTLTTPPSVPPEPGPASDSGTTALSPSTVGEFRTARSDSPNRTPLSTRSAAGDSEHASPAPTVPTKPAHRRAQTMMKSPDTTRPRSVSSSPSPMHVTRPLYGASLSPSLRPLALMVPMTPQFQLADTPSTSQLSSVPKQQENIASVTTWPLPARYHESVSFKDADAPRSYYRSLPSFEPLWTQHAPKTAQRSPEASPAAAPRALVRQKSASPGTLQRGHHRAETSFALSRQMTASALLGLASKDTSVATPNTTFSPMVFLRNLTAKPTQEEKEDEDATELVGSLHAVNPHVI